MKTLYILGNGFDLAHGLKTKYSDFYNYLSKDQDTQSFLYNMIDAYGAYDEEWWNSFEESLGDGTWFEYEFENMAESVIENMVTDDGDEMPDIEFTLESHWESYYKFMEKLNVYVLKWINDSIDLSEVEPMCKMLIEEDALFINFNYTMVLEEIYKISERNVLHVHGSVAERKAVMGHGNVEVIDKYRALTEDDLEKLDKNGATVNDAIASFYEATYKDTEAIISLNSYFWKRLSEVESVHIYGHSLGIVDKPYFDKIKSCIPDNAEWFFYNYDKTEEEIRGSMEALGVKQEYISIIPSENFFD